MRVEEDSGAPSAGRTGTPLSPIRAFALVLLAGGAVFAVIGLYLIATTCWRSSVFALDDGVTSGCRNRGAAEALYPLLFAQLLGVAGFVLFRRVPRRGRMRDASASEEWPEERLPTITATRALAAAALSVLLLGGGVLLLYLGMFSVGYTCLWDSGCNARTSTIGMLIVVFGEVLGIAGFLLARWAFRRRPWRRNTPPEPST